MHIEESEKEPHTSHNNISMILPNSIKDWAIQRETVIKSQALQLEITIHINNSKGSKLKQQDIWAVKFNINPSACQPQRR